MRRRLDCWRARREVGEVGYCETAEVRTDPVSLVARRIRSVSAPGRQMQRRYQCPLRGACRGRGWGWRIEGPGREAADVGAGAINGHGPIVPGRTASGEGDWERAGRAYSRHRPGRCLRRAEGRRSVLLNRHVQPNRVGFRYRQCVSRCDAELWKLKEVLDKLVSAALVCLVPPSRRRGGGLVGTRSGTITLRSTRSRSRIGEIFRCVR